jgi:hypothetical protein
MTWPGMKTAERFFGISISMHGYAANWSHAFLKKLLDLTHKKTPQMRGFL